MNIIFLGKFKCRPLHCQLKTTKQLVVCGVLTSVAAVLLLATGYWYGSQHNQGYQQRKTGNLTALKKDISIQKALIKQARLNTATNLDALTARIGKMQANVIRLNALGERLVKVAKLDAKEFDFRDPPAYGGPVEQEMPVAIDFGKVINDLNNQLASRESQLEILEDILMNRQLHKQTTPSGRPILKGWTSSYFGKRIDPFTGKLAMHKGMDFAGKEGSTVIAAAEGVVTWAGHRSGYGNLVEINHGNGYSTRYGHNEKILVKVGDIVKKGQTISLMGSTGRSTGPHVHFEVLKNEQQINPARFVAAK